MHVFLFMYVGFVCLFVCANLKKIVSACRHHASAFSEIPIENVHYAARSRQIKFIFDDIKTACLQPVALLSVSAVCI